ncbi:MAG: hypothetical protein ACRD1Z_17390, partial [Vicinamibacteria bacterium]
MQTALETEKVGRYTVEIHTDPDAESPREWSNIGKMICFHKRYTLGDKHDFKHDDFSGWAELEKHLREKEGAVLVLPLYLFDHSGITMRTEPFGDPWDSGQVGLIYATEAAILEAFLKKKLGSRVLELARKNLIGEVKDYDDFLTGQVYGYIIKDENGEDVDSCWGFFGGIEYCREEARAAVPKPKKKAKKSKRAK